MAANEFQCAICRGVFEKAWSDAEADAEAALLFPSVRPDQLALVCDECFDLCILSIGNLVGRRLA